MFALRNYKIMHSGSSTTLMDRFYGTCYNVFIKNSLQTLSGYLIIICGIDKVTWTLSAVNFILESLPTTDTLFLGTHERRSSAFYCYVFAIPSWPS